MHASSFNSNYKKYGTSRNLIAANNKRCYNIGTKVKSSLTLSNKGVAELNKLSLKRKYFLSITLICLVSLAVVSLVSYQISYRIVLASTTSRIEMASERYTHEIDSWLTSQMDRLNEIKNDIEYNSTYFQDKNLEALLASKLEISGGQVLDYYIGFSDKSFLSGTGWQPSADYDCTGRAWYREALRTNQMVFTLPYVDSDTKKMIITISEPLVIEGRTVGVLAVDITVDHLVKLVNHIKIASGSYAFLIDNKKNIMTYPIYDFLPTDSKSYQIDEILNGRFAELGKQIEKKDYSLIQLKDCDGKDKYFYLSEIKSSKWILGFSIPTSEITHSLTALLKGFASACIIAILISMVIISPLLNQLLKPVMHLTSIVKRFGDKDLDVRCEIETKDEIGELGKSFNDMADIIQNYSINLENKVRERTRELNEKNEKIQDSIEYAKMIQQTILPDEEEIRKVLKDYFIIWKPRDIVGGDFYWMRKFEDGFIIVVGDCTGHGVPGALMTMAVSAILDRIVEDICHDDPAFILTELNRLLNQSLRRGSERAGIQDGLDAGVLFVSGQGCVFYSGAHISLYLIKDGETVEIKGGGRTIGKEIGKKEAFYENHKISLEPEMSCYMATDGITDQIGGEQKLPFGKKGLLAILQSIQHLPMEEQKKVVWSACEDYRRDEIRRDDITLIGFKL